MSIINVVWGKERIRIQFPDDPSTPLRFIREQLAEHTGLAADRFRLIKSGAIMKDDHAPLSAYGLKPGATIALMGSAESLDEKPAAANPSFGVVPKLGYNRSELGGHPTESSILQTIQGEVESVRKTLEPAVTSFLSSILSETAKPTEANPLAIPAISREDAKTTHARLGELLLQALLRLDAITPESDWAEVRSTRKSAVKEVQGLLDQLDNGWRNANFELEGADNA